MNFVDLLAQWNEHEARWTLVREWVHDDCTCYLIRVNAEDNTRAPFNGYATFPIRPVLEPGYKGILNFAPVHGGITYAEAEGDKGITYGFDCAHGGDEDKPHLQNPEWVAAEIHRMILGVRVAANYEAAYLAATDPAARAEVLDAYHQDMLGRGVEFDITNNFGAMIQMLGGLLDP